MKADSQSRAYSNLLPLGIALTALTALVLGVDVPPLIDYPNHLARAVFLARGEHSALNHFYYASWSNMPNLAIDLLLIPFLTYLPPAMVGKLLCLFVLIALLASVAFYARMIFG